MVRLGGKQTWRSRGVCGQEVEEEEEAEEEEEIQFITQSETQKITSFYYEIDQETLNYTVYVF